MKAKTRTIEAFLNLMFKILVIKTVDELLEVSNQGRYLFNLLNDSKKSILTGIWNTMNGYYSAKHLKL